MKRGNVNKNKAVLKVQISAFFLKLEQNPRMEPFEITFQRAPCGDLTLALKKLLKFELFTPPYIATIFLPQIPFKL